MQTAKHKLQKKKEKGINHFMKIQQSYSLGLQKQSHFALLDKVTQKSDNKSKPRTQKYKGGD